ncbi:MAG: hypothetical protein ABJF01_21315 [bacterium]
MLKQSSSNERPRGFGATLLLACSLAACGDGTATAPLSHGNVSVASKLATVAVAIATASEGAGFFDNYLPCPRRGIVDYRNSDHGRLATFSGCDLGDGIVVDGSTELRWTTPGADRSRIVAIDIPGTLRVTTVGGQPLDVAGVSVSSIAFSAATIPNTPPAVERFQYALARVTIGDETFTPNALADPARVFVSGLSLDAIPAVTIDALTDADMKRLAYHAAIALAAVLFDETEDVRASHIHTLRCGTIRVTADPVRNLPTLDMNWNACDLGQGLIISGSFTVDWAQFDVQTGAIAMRVVGPMTLGGGLPRTDLTRLDWSLSGVGAFPANAHMTMQIAGGGKQRSFSVNFVLDD